jgi:cell division control protein 45
LDLFEEFELNLNPQLTLYVMDSHRPYHPSNYSNARQVCTEFLKIPPFLTANSKFNYPKVFLFDDSDEPIENPTGPPPDQLDYGLPPIYNVTGDADMDDVYDADDIDERPPEEPIEDEEEEEGEDDDEDDEEAAINKRRRRLASFRENLAIPHAFTSAGLMYALASKLERETNELLWYAIVGLTDQFIHQRIDRMRYLGDMQHFREEVLRTNIQDDETAPVGSSHTTDANRIVFIPEDYNFMLYRCGKRKLVFNWATLCSFTYVSTREYFYNGYTYKHLPQTLDSLREPVPFSTHCGQVETVD